MSEKNIFLMGPPAAGKGIQSELIVKKLRFLMFLQEIYLGVLLVKKPNLV